MYDKRGQDLLGVGHHDDLRPALGVLADLGAVFAGLAKEDAAEEQAGAVSAAHVGKLGEVHAVAVGEPGRFNTTQLIIGATQKYNLTKAQPNISNKITITQHIVQKLPKDIYF